MKSSLKKETYKMEQNEQTEGADEVEDVKQCFYETDNFNGASGVFGIDDNGDAVKTIFFKTVKDGKFVRYSE